MPEAPTPSLELEWLDGDFAVWRLDPGASTPVAGEPGPGLLSVTRTAEEVSVVGPEAMAPSEGTVSGGWAALRVRGELDHALVGILASLTGALAAVEVPVFAISTFDTDYVLVPGARRDEATAGLRAAGHRIG